MENMLQKMLNLLRAAYFSKTYNVLNAMKKWLVSWVTFPKLTTFKILKKNKQIFINVNK